MTLPTSAVDTAEMSKAICGVTRLTQRTRQAREIYRRLNALFQGTLEPHWSWEIHPRSLICPIVPIARHGFVVNQSPPSFLTEPSFFIASIVLAFFAQQIGRSMSIYVLRLNSPPRPQGRQAAAATPLPQLMRLAVMDPAVTLQENRLLNETRESAHKF